MKENTLFKLDLLQSYYLQKPARFGITKQILRSDRFRSQADGKEKHEKHRHKLLQLSRDEARKMIQKLQEEAFEKKFHFIETNLNRAVTKALKKERQRHLKDPEKLQAVDTLLQNASNLLHENLENKIYKRLLKSFPTRLNIKSEVFEGLPADSIKYIKNMKDNNPYKTNSLEINNLLSKIFAEKNVKQALEHIDTMEIVWGPKTYKKDDNSRNFNEDELADFEEDNNLSNDLKAEKTGETSSIEKTNDASIDYEDLYESYKTSIVASSDEESDNELVLDPSMNYNEITDDEPSGSDSDDDDSADDNERSTEEEVAEDSGSNKVNKKRSLEEDDFFASEEKKTQSSTRKMQLPVLASGYYSGGESDVEKDDLVDEITKTRKNRRGQRARQKIWEKKYGKSAKHVIQQHERFKSERERLKAEFEERQRKREAKQKLREERENQKGVKQQKIEEKSKFVHPSWEAKLKQQEALKNAKFAGKKITFD